MSEKITAELRTEFGKGFARRIRATGKIPAVLYGHGEAPVHLTLPGHTTMMALRHGGANTILEFELDGETRLALAKEVQVDPIRRAIEHVDLLAVVKGETITVEIPVAVVGKAAAGTLIVTDASVLEVEAEATHVPETIEVSVEGAEAGTLIHASDVVLPEGVTLVTAGDVLVVNVTIPAPEEPAEGDAEAPAAE